MNKIEAQPKALEENAFLSNKKCLSGSILALWRKDLTTLKEITLHLGLIYALF